MTFLFQRVLTHYNVPIFARLNESLGGELVVVYGQTAKGTYLTESPDALPFRHFKVRNFWLKGERAVWQNFLKPFSAFRGRPRTVIMEASPRILSIFPLYLYCKSRRIPFVLWGHGGSRKREVAGSLSPKDFIHRWLIRRSDAYICYSDGIRESLSRITDADKLFIARNTIDTGALLSIRDELEKKGKDNVKEQLGLKRGRYICFIGRLLPDKRVDYLLEVFAMLKKTEDAGLLIIGDGPESGRLMELAGALGVPDVHFLGSIPEWKRSAPYLFSSDVLVMPGYVGLSVNHAYCFGLPVITQMQGDDGPFHSPEIEYLIEGETGYQCRRGDREHMAECIRRVFEDQERFNSNVTAYCRRYLLAEQMVEGMKGAVRHAAARA